MTDRNGFPIGHATSPAPIAALHERVKFSRDNAFQVEVRRRVDEYFRRSGRTQRDCWQMYLKSAVVLASFTACYVVLVFVANTWWQALPLAVLLGLATAGVGLTIQHDGGHRAYSDRPWVNRLAALTLDLIGGSSYIYTGRHTIFHHTYTNVAGLDTDINVGILGRMAPEQKRRAFHRWQHYYLWPLYGFMVVQWHLISDFRDVLVGKIQSHQFPRPRGRELAYFIGGKAVFLTIAFVIPCLMHPFLAVLLFYGVAAIVMGIVLAVVFQLAHCVEEADFPVPQAGTRRIGKSWAVHQVETTVDFARGNKLVAYLLGGLNYQIEHHLFPRICHIHYPELSKIVEATCRDFGIRYAEHKSVWAGTASHFRWLRRMATTDQVTA